MRRCALVAGLIGVSLALEASAFAADPGGKGKPSSSTPGSGPSGGGEGSSGSTDVGLGSDRPTSGVGAIKPVWAPWFDLSLLGEYHHIIANYTGQNVANENLQSYLITAAFNPSPYDRFIIRYGILVPSLKEIGEPAVRSDDITIAYTRLIPLPGKVNLRIIPRVDFGTAYLDVAHGGTIASPRLSISLERTFGPVTLYAIGLGQYYFDKYTTYGSTGSYNTDPNGMGGNETPKGRIATVLEASLAMPFHKPLVVGVSGYFAATWNNVAGCEPVTLSGYMPSCQASSDPLSPTQPVENSFGGEAFIRYSFPTVGGVGFDLTGALANGDPTLGYQGLLHDGVARMNFGYNKVSEVYFSLNVKY